MSRGSLTSVHRLPTMRAARFFWSPGGGEGQWNKSLSLCFELHELGAQVAHDAGRMEEGGRGGKGIGRAGRDQCIGTTSGREMLSGGSTQRVGVAHTAGCTHSIMPLRPPLTGAVAQAAVHHWDDECQRGSVNCGGFGAGSRRWVRERLSVASTLRRGAVPSCLTSQCTMKVQSVPNMPHLC